MAYGLLRIRGVHMKSKKLKRYFPLFLLGLPGMLYLFINNYIPMLGIVIAFKNINFSKGIFASDWVGLKNFEYLFKTKDAFIITRNTIGYNILFICANLFLAVLFAIVLSELRSHIASRVYQTLILLPYLISMVIVSYLVFAFLGNENGFVNNTLLPMFGGGRISWYTQPKYWVVILPLVYVWKNVGYSTVIYLASVIGIDPEYYEAARLDGAGTLQKIRYITLPLIRPTIIMLTLLNIGRIFYSDFGLFYQVPQNSGALFSTTNVIDTYVYRALIKLGDIGMSSAAGVYQSLVGFVLIMLSNSIVRKIDKENALF